MDIFAQILRFLDIQMTTPQPYGLFHLLWFGVSIAGAVALCLWHRKHPTNQPKVILGITAIVILLELYKQINYSFSYESGISFDYQWYIFPFQFCSTPMYAGLLAGLTRKGKLHTAACAYLASYALFAGAAVMFYPTTVFVGTVGINIQTMVCHGSMIFIGIYLLATGYVKAEHKTILKALPLFCVFVAMAVVMNEIAHLSGLLERETFNMFFVSPYCEPHLPVYSLVQESLDFPWCLMLYVLGFTAASHLLMLPAILLRRPKQQKKPIPAMAINP